MEPVDVMKSSSHGYIVYAYTRWPCLHDKNTATVFVEAKKGQLDSSGGILSMEMTAGYTDKHKAGEMDSDATKRSRCFAHGIDTPNCVLSLARPARKSFDSHGICSE